MPNCAGGLTLQMKRAVLQIRPFEGRVLGVNTAVDHAQTNALATFEAGFIPIGGAPTGIGPVGVLLRVLRNDGGHRR